MVSRFGGLEPFFKAMDSNEDGILSQTEHAAGSAAMFQNMDGNSDGKLTAQEFDAGHAGL